MSDFASASTVAVDGAELAYRERGEGEPVVLVHGSLSDLRIWDQQLPAFAGSYRTIAYSRRYSPPGPPLPAGEDDPMPAHVDDLLALLDALEAEPAHLVGASWGGFICLLAAIRRPAAVRSLVLIEPPAMTLFTSGKPGPGDLIKLLFRRPKVALALARFGAGTFAPAERALKRGDDAGAAEAFSAGVLGPQAAAAVPEERRRQVVENAGTLRGQLLGAGFPPIDEERVRAIEAPALILTAEGSPQLFGLIAERLAELLPAAERRNIPNASHNMNEADPRATNDAILSFLGRVGG